MAYQQMRSVGIAAQEQSSRKRVNRRSHLEIRMDVLKAIMEGAEGPTQIMYKANLSWILLWDHLTSLTGLGFVEEKAVGSRKKYSLTGRGIDVVQSYVNIVRELTHEVSRPLE